MTTTTTTTTTTARTTTTVMTKPKTPSSCRLTPASSSRAIRSNSNNTNHSLAQRQPTPPTHVLQDNDDDSSHDSNDSNDESDGDNESTASNTSNSSDDTKQKRIALFTQSYMNKKYGCKVDDANRVWKSNHEDNGGSGSSGSKGSSSVSGKSVGDKLDTTINSLRYSTDISSTLEELYLAKMGKPMPRSDPEPLLVPRHSTFGSVTANNYYLGVLADRGGDAGGARSKKAGKDDRVSKGEGSRRDLVEKLYNEKQCNGNGSNGDNGGVDGKAGEHRSMRTVKGTNFQYDFRIDENGKRSLVFGTKESDTGNDCIDGKGGIDGGSGGTKADEKDSEHTSQQNQECKKSSPDERFNGADGVTANKRLPETPESSATTTTPASSDSNYPVAVAAVGAVKGTENSSLTSNEDDRNVVGTVGTLGSDESSRASSSGSTSTVRSGNLSIGRRSSQDETWNESEMGTTNETQVRKDREKDCRKETTAEKEKDDPKEAKGSEGTRRSSVEYGIVDDDDSVESYGHKVVTLGFENKMKEGNNSNNKNESLAKVEEESGGVNCLNTPQTPQMTSTPQTPQAIVDDLMQSEILVEPPSTTEKNEHQIENFETNEGTELNESGSILDAKQDSEILERDESPENVENVKNAESGESTKATIAKGSSKPRSKQKKAKSPTTNNKGGRQSFFRRAFPKSSSVSLSGSTGASESNADDSTRSYASSNRVFVSVGSSECGSSKIDSMENKEDRSFSKRITFDSTAESRHRDATSTVNGGSFFTEDSSMNKVSTCSSGESEPLYESVCLDGESLYESIVKGAESFAISQASVADGVNVGGDIGVSEEDGSPNNGGNIENQSLYETLFNGASGFGFAQGSVADDVKEDIEGSDDVANNVSAPSSADAVNMIEDEKDASKKSDGINAKVQQEKRLDSINDETPKELYGGDMYEIEVQYQRSRSNKSLSSNRSNRSNISGRSTRSAVSSSKSKLTRVISKGAGQEQGSVPSNGSNITTNGTPPEPITPKSSTDGANPAAGDNPSPTISMSTGNGFVKGVPSNDDECGNASNCDSPSRDKKSIRDPSVDSTANETDSVSCTSSTKRSANNSMEKVAISPKKKPSLMGARRFFKKAFQRPPLHPVVKSSAKPDIVTVPTLVSEDGRMKEIIDDESAFTNNMLDEEGDHWNTDADLWKSPRETEVENNDTEEIPKDDVLECDGHGQSRSIQEEFPSEQVSQRLSFSAEDASRRIPSDFMIGPSAGISPSPSQDSMENLVNCVLSPISKHEETSSMHGAESCTFQSSIDSFKNMAGMAAIFVDEKVNGKDLPFLCGLSNSLNVTRDQLVSSWKEIQSALILEETKHSGANKSSPKYEEECQEQASFEVPLQDTLFVEHPWANPKAAPEVKKERGRSFPVLSSGTMDWVKTSVKRSHSRMPTFRMPKKDLTKTVSFDFPAMDTTHETANVTTDDQEEREVLQVAEYQHEGKDCIEVPLDESMALAYSKLF